MNPRKIIDTGRNRWTSVLLIVLFVFLTGETTTGRLDFFKEPTGQIPRLILDNSVNADFKALAMESWGLFLDVFSTRSDCFGDVNLKVSRDLNNRAAYDPASGTVTVRVPGTKAMLQSALIHEWAHHVEFNCPAHHDLRPHFLAAMKLPADTPWRPDGISSDSPAGVWAQIPSEHYAETSIELVLGERKIPANIIVSREELKVLKDWVSDK